MTNLLKGVRASVIDVQRKREELQCGLIEAENEVKKLNLHHELELLKTYDPEGQGWTTDERLDNLIEIIQRSI